MGCDVCGKNDAELVNLLDTYQTADVKQICPDCEKACNKHLSKLRSVTHNILRTWMQRWLGERRDANRNRSTG